MPKFSAGQVVRHLSGDLICITAIKPRATKNPYIGHKLSRNSQGTTYLWRERDMIEFVRDATPEEMALAANRDDRYDHEEGKRHALVMAELLAPKQDRAGWAKLATVEVGDPLLLKSGETVTFRRIMIQGRRFAFTAEDSQGRGMKYVAWAIK